MTSIRSRKLALTALLALGAAACTQVSRAPVAPRPSAGRPSCPRVSRPPVAPRPSAAAAAAEAPLFRFAAYGDTRDGHEAHRQIVADVLSFHPSLVLQTGDLVHHGDAADEWRIFDDIT